MKLRSGLSINSNNKPVQFQRPNHLSLTLDSSSITYDIQCSTSAHILGELEKVAEIKTQLYCHLRSPEGSTQNGRRHPKQSRSWFLNIIIFGTEALEEKVGEYLSKRKMYLQDPMGCERCVPYRNPHIIPPDSGEIMMTEIFDSALGNLEIERLEAGPDLLEQLMEDDIPLPETGTPGIVKTSLFP